MEREGFYFAFQVQFHKPRSFYYKFIIKIIIGLIGPCFSLFANNYILTDIFLREPKVTVRFNVLFITTANKN